MKALLNVNGHNFAIENKTLIVDGVLLDIKLKPSLFGANTSKIGNKKWKTNIGKNAFVIDDKGFEVNGESFSYSDIDKLKAAKGVVKKSNTTCRYTFTDVQMINTIGKKISVDTKATSQKTAKTRFSLFSVGDITQVGSVTVVHRKNSQKNENYSTTKNVSDDRTK